MRPTPLDQLVPILQLAIGPVAVLILALFVAALFNLEAGWLIVGLFCVSQVSLVGAMLTFIRDMNLALAAVRLELQR
jgi:hypothetical protein